MDNKHTDNYGRPIDLEEEYQKQIIQHKEKILDLCAERTRMEARIAELEAEVTSWQAQCDDARDTAIKYCSRRDELLRKMHTSVKICGCLTRDEEDEIGEIMEQAMAMFLGLA